MTDDVLSRRRFLNAALTVGALSRLLRAPARESLLAPLARAGGLRVGVVLSDPARGGAALESARRGVELGAEESARTAALFGIAVDVLYDDSARTDADALRAAQRLLARSASALVVGLDGPACHVIERELAPSGALAILVFLSCTLSNGREPVCDRVAFQIQPSDEALERARRAQAGNASSAVDPVHVALWHHSLRRFGAEQLNERFRRRFGTDMDSLAWAGWVAMKILTEAALRARSTAAADLARYLRRPNSRFDGHKGEPLSFDARTGELLQPLYLVGGGGPTARDSRVIAEVPAEAAGTLGPACAAKHADRA